MYEHITYENILERMINRVKGRDPNIDTREGSVIYDALAPAALELKNMYIEADFIFNETFADTASRENLIKRVKERGVIPQPATKTILKGVFTPTTLEIPIGHRFSLDKLNYRVVEKIRDGEYRMECETSGEIGNSNLGRLIPIEYLDGLETAKLSEILIQGEDEESTESIRQRYYNSLLAETYGGNKADYKSRVSLIPGVGGVKVFSGTEWNGGGTVKVVVTDSNYGKPSKTLVDEIQTELDPITNHGEGIGIAPIGHIVTVTGVNEEVINIQTKLSYQLGYRWEDVKTLVEKTIDEYFKELNKLWDNSKNIVIRISQIETKLLSVQGVIDVTGTRLNGEESNWTVHQEAIVKRGEITSA